MNEVIGSYIEESHRSLLAKSAGHPISPQHGPKVISQKLPRLLQKNSPKNGSQQTAPSNAPNLKTRTVCSISDDAHEDALREIDRLMKKNKSLEDDLAIVTAKKLSFKSQTVKNQAEIKKLTATLETIQKDSKYQREDISYKSEMSQAALAELNEMRDTHIREVRLLQRGLQARTDESYRNRVNEIADLVDSLGRAALQRDQANKEKTKLQQKCRQSGVEVKMLHEERQKYLTQNKALRSKLATTQRANNVLMQPRDDIFKLDDDGIDDFSDEEFEGELASFEKRYAVLDDGARGLDQWVGKLHREKGRLEKRSEDSIKDASGLQKAAAQWRELCEQKDAKIEMLESNLKEMQTSLDMVQYEVKVKITGLESQLTAQRGQYESKLKQLHQEAEYARSTAQGYHSLTEKLQTELVRVAEGSYAEVMEPGVHQPYESETSDLMPGSHSETPESFAVHQPSGTFEETVRRVVTDIYRHSLAAVHSTESIVLAQQAQFTKTGELLQLEVRNENGRTVLYGHELSTGDRYQVALSEEQLQELDPEDPWTELFTVVGIALGPPKRLAVPTVVGSRREVPLAPCGVWMVLTLYKYDSRRFFLNGFDLQSQRLVDLVLMEDTLPPEACDMIDAIHDDEVLFDFFLGRVQLFESPPESGDEQDEPPKLRLVFNANVN